MINLSLPVILSNKQYVKYCAGLVDWKLDIGNSAAAGLRSPANLCIVYTHLTVCLQFNMLSPGSSAKYVRISAQSSKSSIGSFDFGKILQVQQIF